MTSSSSSRERSVEAVRRYRERRDKKGTLDDFLSATVDLDGIPSSSFVAGIATTRVREGLEILARHLDRLDRFSSPARREAAMRAAYYDMSPATRSAVCRYLDECERLTASVNEVVEQKQTGEGGAEK